MNLTTLELNKIRERFRKRAKTAGPQGNRLRGDGLPRQRLPQSLRGIRASCPRGRAERHRGAERGGSRASSSPRAAVRGSAR